LTSFFWFICSMSQIKNQKNQWNKAKIMVQAFSLSV
jgi:hypothetical protein